MIIKGHPTNRPTVFHPGAESAAFTTMGLDTSGLVWFPLLLYQARLVRIPAGLPWL